MTILHHRGGTDDPHHLGVHRPRAEGIGEPGGKVRAQVRIPRASSMMTTSCGACGGDNGDCGGGNGDDDGGGGEDDEGGYDDGGSGGDDADDGVVVVVVLVRMIMMTTTMIMMTMVVAEVLTRGKRMMMTIEWRE